MYKFHYDYNKNNCDNNSKLLFIDIDSCLIHEIKTKYVYEDFSKDKEMFDFSSYSTKSKYNDSNKLVVRKIKDETSGAVLQLKNLPDWNQRCIHLW